MEKDYKEIFNELFAASMAVNMSKESLKEQDLKIRTVAAGALGYADKEGKNDPKKIKAGLMKKSIELELTNVNKLEEDLTLMETYHKLIKDGEISKQSVNKYGILMDEVKSANKELSEIKKSAANELDSLELLAMQHIIKEKIEEQNSQESSDKTYSIKNEKALYEKIEELKNILS